MNIRDLKPGSYKVISPQSSGNGLSSSSFPIQAPSSVNDNFYKKLASFAGSVVSPFLKLGATADALGSSKFLGGQGTNNAEVDLGAVGKVKPITTAKEALGTGAELASFAVGGGGAGQILKQGAKGAIKQAVIQGVKAGAVSGALSGGGKALQEDKGLGDTAKETLKGAAAGGVIGGIAGAATGAVGAVANKVKGVALAKQNKESNFILDLVSPKATDKVKIQALKEGRVTEQGLLKASKILPSKRDTQLAEAVKGVVSPKASPAQNLTFIESKVDDINSGVKAYVKVNKVPFNVNQLKTQLNKGKNELNLVFASDKQAEKTYEAVVKEFIKHVEKKDTSGLFDARQTFDNIPAIKKLLDSQGLGENTKKEVVLTVRGMANKYVANLLPKGNKYRETLLRESKMIEVMQNIAEKNSNTIGMNKLQVLTKKYPVLKWGIGLVGAGILGGAGVGVGSTIVSSTD